MDVMKLTDTHQLAAIALGRSTVHDKKVRSHCSKNYGLATLLLGRRFRTVVKAVDLLRRMP